MNLDIYKDFEHIQFPSGERHLRLIGEPACSSYVLTYKSRCPDIMVLAMAVDCLRSQQWPAISLRMPFFPYARQDRRAVPGDALSVRVFAEFINRMDFESVELCDPHSDVTTALVERAIVRNQCDIAWQAIKKHCSQETKIVAPDLGSTKKAELLSKITGHGLVQAHKVRDPATGTLSKFTVLSGTASGADCLIVDDICDGGGTFLGLGAVLRERGAKRLGLYVTHGLFTKGVDILFDVFDYIITTDSVGGEFDSRIHVIGV